ncbi:MAG: pirin family protein [Mycobacteriales bacterium]
MSTEVRRSADRFTTTRPGSTTRHSFSFGHHYDPSNVSFGPIVAVNDEMLAPGAGFDEHPHAGLVIVTYVVTGSLAHQGISSRAVSAGQCAVLRCGTGVIHAERNAGPGELRFVQTWLTSTSTEQSYDVLDVAELAEIGCVDAARVVAGRLPAGSSVEVTGHVFVATGSVTAEGTTLVDGDSLRARELVRLQAVADTQLVLVTWAG